LVRYQPPSERTDAAGTVRNDTGVTEGSEISMFYDPMIAKLVTHAPTRSAAIELQSQALDSFIVDGIQHNIPFLAALMEHPRWKAGELSTGFIAEEFPDGFAPRTPDANAVRVMASVAAAIDHLSNVRRRRISDQMSGGNVRFAQDRVVILGDTRQRLRIAGELGGAFSVSFLNENGGAEAPIAVATEWWPGQLIWNGQVDGQDVSVQVRPILNGARLAYRGVQVDAFVYTDREAELLQLMPVKEAADLSKFLLCPMPGLVKAIHVAPGDRVSAGDALAVVEAMKMENVLRAERDGTVAEVKAAPGDNLAVDEVIIAFA
ncbi:MAG: DUF2118 domain-containing protein, partial [Pseudomonadota bacterium]